MKIVEISKSSDLHNLAAAWDALSHRAASSSIFTSWEWATAWWSAYGGQEVLRVLAAFDDNGVLQGIAPLRARPLQRFGQSVTALSFIGDGSNDSDYLDFIIAEGYEKAVIDSLSRYWANDLRRGTVLQLNEIPETSPSLAPLKEMAGQHGLLWTEAEVECSTVQLPASWDEYLKLLKPRFRTKVRSAVRNLEEQKEMRFGVCEDQRQLQRLLPALFDLHTRRWAQDGKAGVFGWDHKRSFYHILSPLLLDRGWLRFTWLERNGRILACQYGFEYAGTYFQLQEGYEPMAEHLNPGLALRAWSIRELIKKSVHEYDFLGGVNRHKNDWGAVVKNSKQILAGRSTLKNLMFSRGPGWETRTKEVVKKFVPEKVLALYASQKVQPPGISTSGSDGSSASEWLRKTAASCYFNLPLPRMVRPLRDGYQLSIARNGRLPRLSLTKRNVPSGRILCYHRVNDDNDPFFPAISTGLFEQQMRYLAHHYRVVSMSDLLRHLEDGSPTTVVALTFDDGYHDNYQNAFPILQRYGLPATIFLSTDSMDTRRPLWFEQLREACKQTDTQYFDLDISDIPCRLWMRTQEERLRANDRLFSLLRSLDDGERRLRLNEILRHLRVNDEQRHNKMLTWDAVRIMKASNIDFGGHTATHPFMSKLTPETAEWEVGHCKQRIEAELQEPVSVFAYPNGREEDFGSWNKDVLRRAGYRAAATTIWGLNDRSTDPMELRRGGPWESTAALFAYKLDWYQLVND